MSIPDFIETYTTDLSAHECAAIVERFEASGQAQRGATGAGVDVQLKDSWDINLDSGPSWAALRDRLNSVALAGFAQYLRRYAHVALAPLQLKMRRPDGGLQPLGAEDVAGMDDALLGGLIAKVFRPGAINLQKYLADQGGYPYWHCEQYPKLDRGEALHRALLWTVYLNEDFEQGETEFLYQQRRVAPRTGQLLIAPGGFTHTHRGNKPRGGNKYIATSWFLYQRAEQLFAP
jgi:hypothetical protein